MCSKTNASSADLLHISFTQGEVYSGLEIKTAEAKFDPQDKPGEASVFPPQPHVLSNEKAYFWGLLCKLKYLYIQILLVLPNKSWKQRVGCVIPTIQMGKLETLEEAISRVTCQKGERNLSTQGFWFSLPDLWISSGSSQLWQGMSHVGVTKAELES